jgi:hypothetical protein
MQRGEQARPNGGSDFGFVLREIRYHINPQYALEYSKRIRLRALRDGLTQFVDKVAWSAGPPSTPRVVDGKCVVGELPDAGGLWSHYRIQFGRKLKRNEQIEFELRWPELGNWTSAKPFASSTVHDRVDKLSFDLVIPKAARADDRAVLEQLRSPDSTDALSADQLTFDDKGALRWDIEKPEKGRHFRVSWRWHAIIAGPASDLPSVAAEPVPVSANHRR